MSVLFTLQQFILVMFLLLTVLFYISTPLQMMFQSQWFFKGSLVLVIWSSVLSGSDHLDVLIIRSGRSVLCQVWSSWYSSIREVPRQLWRCTSSPSGCLLSSCWWDRQKLTSTDVGDKTADTADRAGPEFTQLMLIHRKVLKLLQFRTHFDRLLSNFTVVCENVFMSIDEHDIIQSDPFSHFKGTVHLFTCSWIYSFRLFCWELQSFGVNGCRGSILCLQKLTCIRSETRTETIEMDE